MIVNYKFLLLTKKSLIHKKKIWMFFYLGIRNLLQKANHSFKNFKSF